jgi:hypothetical protein
LPIGVIQQKLQGLSGLVEQAAAPGTNFHPTAKTNYRQTENQNISCSNHIITSITMNLRGARIIKQHKKFSKFYREWC